MRQKKEINRNNNYFSYFKFAQKRGTAFSAFKCSEL